MRVIPFTKTFFIPTLDKKKGIEITAKQYQDIANGLLQFDETLSKVVAVPPSQIRTKQNEKRISELKRLLSESDYKAIKFAEGEMSAEEFVETRLQRTAWRAEINALEAEIGGLK